MSEVGLPRRTQDLDQGPPADSPFPTNRRGNAANDTQAANRSARAAARASGPASKDVADLRAIVAPHRQGLAAVGEQLVAAGRPPADRDDPVAVDDVGA